MQNRALTVQSLETVDALVESVTPADLAVCDVAALNGQSAPVHLADLTDIPRGIVVLFCGGIARHRHAYVFDGGHCPRVLNSSPS